MYLWPAVAVAAALVVALFDAGREREAREVAKGPQAERLNERLSELRRAGDEGEASMRGSSVSKRGDTDTALDSAGASTVNDLKEERTGGSRITGRKANGRNIGGQGEGRQEEPAR